MTDAPHCEPSSGGEETGEQRVLVLAPTGRDARLIASALTEEGLFVCECPSFERLCAEMEGGAAAIVVASEALDWQNLCVLSERLREQPPWSDLPVLLLGGPDHGPVPDEMLTPLGNVTVLERPLRHATLLYAVRAALRARRKQYEVRDLLAETERARIDAEYQQLQIEALNEQLRRAMTETHHRVKNNLQIITAMIDMQLLDGLEMVPARELRRLGMHVRMLAAVHDILTHQAKGDGRATHVSAKEVLDRLLSMVHQVAAARDIRFDVDDTRLSARQCTSLAIVVNELISNAVKYGTGRIQARFCAAGDTAVLTVEDDGPGFPKGFNARQAAHTGLELVENLSRWDLGGEVQYENIETGGARVTVRFPLSLPTLAGGPSQKPLSQARAV